MTSARTQAQRHRLLAPTRPTDPISVEHCSGAWIYKQDGSRYLDGSSGLVCVNIGHANPRVIEAMRAQAATVSFAAPAAQWPARQLELVERLTRLVGRPQDSVALASSGTSAVEMAIALARNIARAQNGPRRSHILTANLGYHGNSALTLGLSGHRRRRPRGEDGFGLAPAFPAPYPPSHGGCRCDAMCAEEVAAAIDKLGAENVAAVLIEPINGTTGGAFVPPEGYLRRLSDICRERGVLVIHDEVLTGLGRTGLPLASDRWVGAAPDICVLSKGLGAGYVSAGAVLVAPEKAEYLGGAASDPIPMMGTMTATPLQAAVCLAVLDELEAIGVFETKIRGDFIAHELSSASAGFDMIRDIRGAGFFYGVELRDGTLWQTIAEIERRGVLLYPFSGYRPDGGGEGLIVAPPLNVTESELQHLIYALVGAVSVVENESVLK
ncbi:aspartate aminotransferase family protein [Nocardia sp. NPDC019302]|uniref:class-III pyridoxal-phosphate-dependent aminotransferase n=1 Tax=Nocardia sp. NPDC019302 TaxID=3154592 RepID=UPI0033F31071